MEWASDNKLVYKSTIETGAIVLDACFDLQNRLWATLAVAEEKDDLIAIFEEKDGKVNKKKSWQENGIQECGDDI